jgi:hypothetical protein
MGKSGKRVWGVAAGAIALGIVGASVSVAGLVAGGGPAKSDCYAQWDVKGVAAKNVKNKKKVTCVDGTACDADRTCNGTCVLQVRQCWNQTDPELPSCSPPAELDSLKVTNGLDVPSELDGSSCGGAFVGLSVGTKKDGTKPGKRNFKVTAKAPKGTKPRTDRDTYQVICVPNTAPETCGSSPSGAFLD